MSAVQAIAIDVPPSVEREKLVRTLRTDCAPVLVLDTCQRLELFGPAAADPCDLPVSDRWKHAVAFERLARIAAGLESRILGELEVLGQVRAAYREFQVRTDRRYPEIDRVFQDALALARKARRASGIDRDQTSLSGLASRELLNRVPPGEPVAVIGSGSLARSVTRYLGKRGDSPIRVSSRCPDNAMSLAGSVGGFGAGLDDLAPLLEGVAGIITATAAPHPVLYPHHIEAAADALHIVDLSVPPDCCEAVREAAAVQYVGLEAIESRAKGNAEERRRRAEQAAVIIRDGALAWSRQH